MGLKVGQGEACVDVIGTFPLHPKKLPVLLADWHHSEGRLQVNFGHKRARSMAQNKPGGIIHRGILEGELFSGDIVVDARACWC